MSARTLYEELKGKLHDVVPDAELQIKAELAYEIRQLKTERHAVVLAHNYMEPALFHSIADFTGDSLELCRAARRSQADTLVFCGVRFMAETAKILNPDKTVLLPAAEAGCSLAAALDAADVRGLRSRFPGAPIVVYVNTYAEVKAEADLCCTSANAAAVVEALDADRVILIPDEYLACNVARETGRRTRYADEPLGDVDGQREIVVWRGRCEVHEKFSVGDVARARKQFPDVVVLAHPECAPDVVAAADFSGSTGAMIRHVEQSETRRYLLLTECAMGDNVAAANPDKEMLRLCSLRCPHMNEITLADTLRALRENHERIEVPEAIRVGAAQAIERMLAVA